ncbi:MAG: glycosyltransferase [Alphaproteobacteria bacterium]|nr:glycosyltransferase [Alphaproteobacteria bacterium]
MIPKRLSKIAIYLPDLSGGGAERLQVNLAQIFLNRGVAVEFVLDRAEGPLLDAVPPKATVISLGCKRVLQSLPKLARYLREQKPDILLSNLGHNNIIALWARRLARSGTKIVVAQHNMLSGESLREGYKYRYLPLFYRLFLPWADGIVAVSQGIGEDVAMMTGLPMSRITVIYNGVVTADFEAKANLPVAHPWFGDASRLPVFVAVGRLVWQKDFPTLLRAFAKVVAHKSARLVILGEGPLRAELTSLAAELGISDSLDLAGFKPNPLPFMRQASVVVLSSRFEGFAMVLAEALACGAKIVSTDCQHGPSEILEKGNYGILTPVEDSDALAAAMLAALDAPADKEKLTKRGQKFSLETCGQQYLDLFERL